MPRSKGKRQKAPRSGAGNGETRLDDGFLPRRLRRRLIAAAVGVVLVAAGGWWVWRLNAADSGFQALAAAGRPALGASALHPNFGNAHLRPGQRPQYSTRFPLSGSHADTWSTPGFYASPEAPEMLVHALEHGNIVIYYDAPGDATMRTLKEWAGLFNGMWSGVVVTPMPGLGQAVVLTAWRRMMRQDTFDAAPAAAFIDAYRGRGPENPVR